MVQSKTKSVLLFFNGITLVLGGILCGISASAVKSNAFDKPLTYAMVVFSVFVFGVGFLGYFGAKKESRFLLFLYLIVVSLLTVALFILCAFAFKVATDEAFLIKTWEKLPYDKQRDLAKRIGVNLPENEADAANELTNARTKVLDSAKGQFKTIGGITVTTASILLMSVYSAWKLRKLVKAEKAARKKNAGGQAQQGVPQTAVPMVIGQQQPVYYQAPVVYAAPTQ